MKPTLALIVALNVCLKTLRGSAVRFVLLCGFSYWCVESPASAPSAPREQVMLLHKVHIRSKRRPLETQGVSSRTKEHSFEFSHLVRDKTPRRASLCVLSQASLHVLEGCQSPRLEPLSEF